MPEEFTELSSKILAKNLEITKLTKQLDRTMSDLLDAQDKIDNLHQPWMIDAINKVINLIDNLQELEDTDKKDMLTKLTKIGQHLSSNNSLQEHRRRK